MKPEPHKNRPDPKRGRKVKPLPTRKACRFKVNNTERKLVDLTHWITYDDRLEKARKR